MHKKIIFSGVVVFIFIMVLLPFSWRKKEINYVQAEVFIKPSYVISSDQTWTASQGPYVIQGFCLVNSGVKLTIEPGTIIKFYEKGALYSRGEIRVEGEENNKVHFTSVYDDTIGGDQSTTTNKLPWPGSWGTLAADYGGRLIVNHAVFKYGGNDPSLSGGWKSGVIFVWNSSGMVNIINSEFTENIRALYNYWNSVSPVAINNSKIYNNLYGGVYASFNVYNDYTGNHINVTNNWWGHESGPYYKDYNDNGQGNSIVVIYNQGVIRPVQIIFDPWTGKAEEKEPVIIVPGIMGSYLNKNNEDKDEVWPNLDRMLFSIDDEYLNELVLNSSGLPLDDISIVPSDIIKKIAIEDMWQGLIDELIANGYKENENLFYFPYDWRLDIYDVAGSAGAEYTNTLRAKIEEVKYQTGAGQVDIIAHSMGGLVTKAYMHKFGTTSIDQFIDIATPHLGAPKAFKILMYGDDLGIKMLKIFRLNPLRVKYISQNMPAVYQLLPSLNYFSENEPDNYFIYDMHDLDNNEITGRLDYEQSLDFLKNNGRNNLLLNLGKALHDKIDEYSPQGMGVETYNLAGCGQPTIGQIFILNKEESGEYEYGLKYISGDGTVPLASADNLETVNIDNGDIIKSASKYYVKNAVHSDLPVMDGVRQFVISALKDKADSFLFLNYPNLTKEKDDCNFSGTQVSFHSPVNMHIYDENNNHLGPDENGDLESNIPGANYDIIDNNKFAFLPAGHSYRVAGKATAAGKCNIRIEKIVNGDYKETVYFNEIGLAGSETQIQMVISDTQENYIIEADKEGDNNYETEILPSAVLDDEARSDIIKPETDLILGGESGNNGYYISPVTFSVSARDNLSGVLKTEYSLDGGANWQVYTGTFILTEDGEYEIIYKSTDRAGNVEKNKTKVIKIDTNGPEIEINLPYDNQAILRSEKIILNYNLIDNLSGVDHDFVNVFIDKREINPLIPVDFFEFNLGGHNLKITAVDRAGNMAVKEINFNITADISSVLYDLNRLYAGGLINKEATQNYLILKLGQLEEYILKNGAREEKRIEKIIEIINKCEKTGNYGCKDKFSNYLDKTVYHLAEQDRQYILNHLEILISQLDNFFKSGWIKPIGYDMIKEDLIYLKNDF